jgi:hypothetical protein
MLVRVGAGRDDLRLRPAAHTSVGEVKGDEEMKRKACSCHFSPTGIAWDNGDGCTCRPVRLTKPQLRFLRSALRWTDDDEAAGACAEGSTVRVAAKLEALGLVEFVGHGTSIDGPSDAPERPIYAITEVGRSVYGVNPNAE